MHYKYRFLDTYPYIDKLINKEEITNRFLIITVEERKKKNDINRILNIYWSKCNIIIR